MSIDTGQVYEVTLSVTDKTGAAVNPTAAVVTITLPDQSTYVSGAGANPAVTLPPATTGLLVYDYTTTMAGLHRVAWSGTLPGGAPLPPKVDYFSVRSYASAVGLAQAKTWLGYTKTDKDETIRSLAATATRHAEKIVGSIVPRAITKEHIPGTYRPVLHVPNGPILCPPNTADPTALTVTVASQYPNGPSWANATGRHDIITVAHPGTLYLASLIDFWYGPWLATYTAGRAVVDEEIELGVLEILRDLFVPLRGLTADVAEQQADTLAVAPFYRAPPRAMQLLEPHRMPGFA